MLNAILLSLGLAGAAPVDNDYHELDLLLETQTPRPFSGVLLLARGDEVIYAASRSLSSQPSLSPKDSDFLLASISKQITAALVMLLWDEGRLKLDLPLGHYLPSLPLAWKDKVRLSQLLSHTSGIRSLREGLISEPGAQFLYSNDNYQLLAQVIKAVTGASYNSLLGRLMRSCGIDISQSVAVDSFFENDARQLLANTQGVPVRLQPSAGVVASAQDLVRWNLCLHQGRILSPRAYQVLTKASAVRKHRWGNLGYGAGLQIAETPLGTEYSHSGYFYQPGAVTTLLYYPRQQLSVVILENVAWHHRDMARAFYHHDKVRDWVLEKFSVN